MDKTGYILAGTFIDGSGAAVRRNIFLAVRDGIIAAIKPAAELPRHGETAIDDLSHCTIVPPLVDCSLSLSRSPSVDARVRETAEKNSLVTQHLRYCHSHGVLGVAAIDDISDLEEQVLESISIRTAGRDFLRILIPSNIGDREAPDSIIKQEEPLKILQPRGPKKLIAVANGQRGVQEALEARCDAIEQGYGMGEDNLRKMADMDVLWIPGVLVAKNAMQASASGGDVMCRFSMRYVAPGKADPGAEAFWKKMLNEQLAQLRLARKLGVKTAMGTGAGSVGILHGESMAEEIKLFIKAGYSIEEAIRSASVNGARFFGMEDLGGLAVGRKATFLVVRGSVQQLPRKLAYLENIYVDGAPSRSFF